MAGFYNVSFTGADTLIALLEYHNIKWRKHGLWVSAFGVSKDFVDLIMETAKEYRTF